MQAEQEGVWAVEIGGPLGVLPVGVMVFEQGRVYGGSDRYYYLGRYTLSDDTLKVQVAVTHYNDLAEDLFGHADALPFTLSGTAGGTEIDLVGVMPTHSKTEYMVRLRRLSPLEEGVAP